MKKMLVLLVIIGIMIVLIGFCVYDKGPTVYRVYEFFKK